MKIQSNDHQMTNTYALVDSGSQNTLIREDLANHLKPEDWKNKKLKSALSEGAIGGLL